MKAFIAIALLLSGCAVGPQWTPQASGTDASLRGVCTVSVDVAWASGAGGSCLRTLDGGETWQRLAVPGCESLDFRDVHAADENTALLLSAGEPAKVMKTEDGGTTWAETHADATPGVFFDAMAFWDGRRGIAFSDPVAGSFLLIQTADSGLTWNRIAPEVLPSPMPDEAGFAASGTCITVIGESHVWFGTGGSHARVVRSTDGGRTWSAFPTPLLSGLPSTGIFSICFMDEQRGVIVGGDYKQPETRDRVAAWTDDGGETWTLSREMPGGFRSCVARSGSSLVAVGTTGSEISRDQGVTWEPIGDEGFHSVSFSGAIGFAVGADGTIARIDLSRP